MLLVAIVGCGVPEDNSLTRIPDGLVVLTFDDGNKSDISIVAPKLQEYGFGASFYVTEGLGYEADVNKERYLSWTMFSGCTNSGSRWATIRARTAI